MLKCNWLAVILVMLLPLVSNADPLQLKLSASVEEKYSDHVFSQAGEGVTDFITRLSPAVEGGWRTERTGFLLSWHPDCYYYQENRGMNSVDQTWDGRLSHQWTERLSTSLTAGYLDDEQPERELSETGLLFNTQHRQRWTCGLDEQYQVSEKTAVAMSYGYTDEAFDDPRTFDLRSHSVSVLLSRNLAPLVARTTGRLQVTGASYEYKRSYVLEDLFQTISTDDRQSVEYYSLTLGLAHTMTERLQFTLDLGTRYTRSEREIKQHVATLFGEGDLAPVEMVDTSSGFVGTLETAYASEKSSFSVLLSHDVAPASGRSGLSERTTLRLADNGRLTGDWYYNLSISAYRNVIDATEDTAGTDELTTQLGAGLRYNINLIWNVGIYWGSVWIDDRKNDNSDNQNSCSVKVGWNWPVLE
jgi:hypothetical protein